MIPKPTFYLLMYCNHKVVCWCQLEADEWLIVRKAGDQYQIFDINGSTARILVATEDNDLDRLKALETASSFVYGRYMRWDVDLKTFDVTTTKGRPIDHPPH
jgi:hypothetical protein